MGFTTDLVGWRYCKDMDMEGVGLNQADSPAWRGRAESGDGELRFLHTILTNTVNDREWSSNVLIKYHQVAKPYQ